MSGTLGARSAIRIPPEALLPAISELQGAITDVLGLDAYTVVTRGMNAYDDQAPLHVSARRNYISINSLGFRSRSSWQSKALPGTLFTKVHTFAPNSTWMHVATSSQAILDNLDE